MIYFVIFCSMFLTTINFMMLDNGKKFATSYHIKKEIHKKKGLQQDLLIARTSNRDTTFIHLELQELEN